jgi:hypothetical protein
MNIPYLKEKRYDTAIATDLNPNSVLVTKANESLRDVLQGLHNNITGVSWRWISAGHSITWVRLPARSPPMICWGIALGGFVLGSESNNNEFNNKSYKLFGV